MEASRATYITRFQGYTRKGPDGKGSAIYEDGIKELKSDINLRLSLAKIYETLKISQRAKEEYEKVLALDPTNTYAQKKVKELGGKQ